MAQVDLGKIVGPKGDTGEQGTPGVKGDPGTNGQRGSQWFTGTGVTGTSTTGTVFTGSGVTAALIGDYYINTTSGNLYTCLLAGNASVAKWAFVRNNNSGDSKDFTTTFEEALAVSNIASGESHSTLFGKIKKFFSFIGTTVLTTTAQTISEAINELVTSKLKIGNDYRPNILINPDFKINQEGKASYTTVNQYAVDGWINYGSNVTLTPNALGMHVNCTYVGDQNITVQKVEDFLKYAGKTVTASVKISNLELGSNTSLRMNINDGVVFRNSEPLVNGINTLTMTLASVPTLLNVGFTKYGNGSSFSMDIEWVKLEQNDHATPDIPRNPEEETALCQRYYEKSPLVAVTSARAYGNDYSNFVPYKVKKRVTPSVALSTDTGTQGYILRRHDSTTDVIPFTGNINTNEARLDQSNEAGFNVCLQTPTYQSATFMMQYIADARL